jgi:3-hydroxy-3-methylglutaryl CoA synthase
MNKNEFLKEWERATENLAQYFIARYFGDGADTYWVADEIGGVLYINDYFFSLSDMVDFIRYGYSKDKMFEYYDYRLENPNLRINIKNYLRLK